MAATETAAARWASALAGWAIPAPILAAAPEQPWGFPGPMFKVDPSAPPPPTASRHLARAALGGGGVVLDVGCGGGAASIPLVPPATALVGVDVDADMLALFAAAAHGAGVDHLDVRGRWPDVAPDVAVADVVVCHHVVYNVADIVGFLTALNDHARRLVVLELTERHPQAWLAPLWKRFWGLARPDQPDAGLLAEVVTGLGYRPAVRRSRRPPRKAALDRAGYVALVRRRLCLGADRDAEIDAALGLGSPPSASADTLVSLAWSPDGAPPAVTRPGARPDG